MKMNIIFGVSIPEKHCMIDSSVTFLISEEDNVLGAYHHFEKWKPYKIDFENLLLSFKLYGINLGKDLLKKIEKQIMVDKL